MNTRTIAILTLFACVAARADDSLDTKVANRLSKCIEFACEDRYREVRGKISDLQPLFTWLRILPSKVGKGQMDAPRPLPEWGFVTGKVFQVSDDGILVNKCSNYLGLFLGDSDYQLVFLRNCPWKHFVVDDQPVAFIAVNGEPYSYVTTAKARKTIPSYNYGTPSPQDNSKEPVALPQRAWHFIEDGKMNAIDSHGEVSFKRGGQFDAELVGLHGTNGITIRSAADNHQFSLSLTNLSKEDLEYIARAKNLLPSAPQN